MVEEVVRIFSQNLTAGYRVIGQVVENKEDISSLSLPILGEIKNIEKIVKKENLDMLIITFPLREQNKVTKILLALGDLPIEIRFVPDPYEMITSRISFYEIGGLSLMGLKEFPLTGWNKVLKRGMDIIVSFLVLLVTVPILLITAIAIKLTSRGPVFFRQERIGLRDKRFLIYKFRTMYVGAEKFDEEAGLGIANDPRCTKIGRFLRKTGIDELPQLINVLKGDMSLVGPRPERTHFVKKFKEEVFRYVERHRVKPGITGWAQVNGLRGDTSLEERIKYDLYYIENWSLGFDMKILLRTIGTIITGKNVY
jgi:Undecaprenyl-phosphate glucose phosphotransferase